MPHPNIPDQPSVGLPEISLRLRHASPDAQAVLGELALGQPEQVGTEQGMSLTDEAGRLRRAAAALAAATASLNRAGTTGNALANAGALPGESAPAVRAVLWGVQAVGYHQEAREAGLSFGRAVVAAVKTTVTGRPPLEVYILTDDAVGLGEDDGNGSNGYRGDIE